MPRLIERVLRALGHRLTHGTAAAAVALLSGRAAAADGLLIALANRYFMSGNYAAARALFAAVGDCRYSAKARQMMDWIDFKFGEVGRGWPRYPGADFDPDCHTPATASVGTRITVQNPNYPVALVTELGLTRWRPGMPTPKPVLVWFNFRASLGGELLCAKIVKRLRDTHGLPMLLAGDARLGDVLRTNFPGCDVIDKDGDLAGLSARCSSLLLARDTLALLVRTPADFAPIAALPLDLPMERPEIAGARPKVAISWKTTNPTQGRYRNIPAQALAGMLSRFDIDFHSAQHGVTPAERQSLKMTLGDRIHFNTVDTRASVGALAASLSAMDAVVTIDNSVLHIAGAFGLPTAGLLSIPSYWAWPVEGPDARWYGNVTLIHQKHAGDWVSVLGELETYLDRLDRAVRSGSTDSDGVMGGSSA